MRDAHRHTHTVAGEIECFAGEQSGDLMMAVPVARRPAENRDDHVRPEITHDADDVAQDRILRPVLVRLFGALRESEIECAREVLMAAVDAPRGEQFLGANRAERVAELVANEILTAVAARQ